MPDLPTAPSRVFPVPNRNDDDRFSFSLLFDIGGVLVRHGYPRPQGMDFVDLQQALFRFLYRAD